MLAAMIAPELDLAADPSDLTAALIDIASVSGSEGPLADAVEAALSRLPHLTVHRDGDAVVARTELGRPERVVLAGHLDTVPLPTAPGARGTVPSTWTGADGDRVLYGRGATDMKGGVAVQLVLAAALTAPNRDITYVFYDHEEVDADASGLGRLQRHARSQAMAHQPERALAQNPNIQTQMRRQVLYNGIRRFRNRGRRNAR